jgi:hypothetical protein
VRLRLARTIEAELKSIQGPGSTMTDTTTFSTGTSTERITTKKQLLHALNQDHFPTRTAMNQAAIALAQASKTLARAMKEFDASYYRKRADILNGHDPQD